MRTFLTAWLPPIAWATLILTASSDSFSSTHTVSWLESILHLVTGHAFSPATVEMINAVIRKCAHIVEYGILAMLTHRALRRDHKGWRLAWALGAVLLTACVATIDEIHQSYVPSRTGTWHDVLIDTGAAIAGQGLLRALQMLPFRAR